MSDHHHKDKDHHHKDKDHHHKQKEHHHEKVKERKEKNKERKESKKEQKEKVKAANKRERKERHGESHELHQRPAHPDDWKHGCVAGLTAPPPVVAGHAETPHWSYDGEHGCAHWSEMGFSQALGKNQSPIDIKTSEADDIALPKLDINYEDEEASILNNGHTIQVNWPAGSMLIGEKEYHLLQFHFHAPSEHSIDGKLYPLEMHLVHKSDEGTLAVLAVLFKEKAGKPNEFLDQFWDVLPTAVQHEGDKPILIGELDAYDLELNLKKHYRYMGSLTTPPCSEGVIWTVLSKPEPISPEQVKHFNEVLKIKNNRPVQPLNDRKVTV